MGWYPGVVTRAVGPTHQAVNSMRPLGIPSEARFW